MKVLDVCVLSNLGCIHMDIFILPLASLTCKRITEVYLISQGVTQLHSHKLLVPGPLDILFPFALWIGVRFKWDLSPDGIFSHCRRGRKRLIRIVSYITKDDKHTQTYTEERKPFMPRGAIQNALRRIVTCIWKEVLVHRSVTYSLWAASGLWDHWIWPMDKGLWKNLAVRGLQLWALSPCCCGDKC